jgi:hypothetical protein
VFEYVVYDDSVCRLLTVERALNDGNSGPDAEVGKSARRLIGNVLDWIRPQQISNFAPAASYLKNLLTGRKMREK